MKSPLSSSRISRRELLNLSTRCVLRFSRHAHNQVASTYFNSVSTFIPVGYEDLEVQMTGKFFEANSNLVFYSNAAVVNGTQFLVSGYIFAYI